MTNCLNTQRKKNILYTVVQLYVLTTKIEKTTKYQFKFNQYHRG